MSKSKLLILLLLLVSFSKYSLSQDLPFVDGKVVYEVRIELDGMSKKQVFDKSLGFVDEVLKKHQFVVKTLDNDSGEIITSGLTALTDKDRKGFVWDIGEASRLRFEYTIQAEEGHSKIKINNITVVKLDVNKEISKPFEDDILEEKRSIQSFKDGKFKRSREKRYNKIADNVNNTFYSMIALYKRYVEQ